MSFVVAFGVAFALIPPARRLGLATGLVDRPADPTLAIHTRPVPILGGPAVIGATFGAAAVVGGRPAGMLIGAVILALAAGIVDDVRPLPPAIRVLVLAGAGAMLALGGLDLEPFGVFAGAATVLLVVTCANAANILDGQNGLAGGLGALAALGLGGLAPAGSGASGLGFALAGALVGFLAWNLPGRIFLGNGGAYAVGTALAALAAEEAGSDGWRGLAAAAACLGVFAFETVFTIARRLASGEHLTAGDRLHSYDILGGKWGSRFRGTAAFWAAGAAAAVVGFVAGGLPAWGAWLLVACAGLAAAAAGVRLWTGRNTST